MTMQSKPDIFEGYAQECQERASAVHDRTLKALFLDLAHQWCELAATTRSLSALQGIGTYSNKSGRYSALTRLASRHR
jgi:hypothetical protein